MNCSKLIDVKTMLVRYAGSVLDLEIKCQDYPHDLEFVRSFSLDDDKIGFVAYMGRKEVGYALCDIQENPESKKMRLYIGILPSMRDKSISKCLMVKVTKHAMSVNCDSIVVYVPSYKIDDPNDPDYIGWWFESMQLKAARVEDRYFFRYGKLYDAYIFEAAV